VRVLLTSACRASSPRRLAGLKNGAPLVQIAGRFGAFVTVDKSLLAPQKIDGLSFAVIVLRAPSNQLKDLLPVVAALMQALADAKPGDFIAVTAA